MQITRQAIERAKRSIEAADILLANANVIAVQCQHAKPDQVVMSIITPELVFSSAEIIALMDLRDHIWRLAWGSWHMIFSPKTNLASIQQRAKQMKEISARKLAAMQRWVANHPSQPPT